MVEEERLCQRCGKDISNTHGQRLYCDGCRKAVIKEQVARRSYERRHGIKAQKPERQCKLCGKEFTANSSAQRYCSKECVKRATALARSKNGYLPTTCCICGKEFLAKSVSTVCCSEQCSEIRQARLRHRKAKCKKDTLVGKVLLAEECNLDYGTYVALIKSGRTHEELKALYATHDEASHSHVGHYILRSWRK